MIKKRLLCVLFTLGCWIICCCASLVSAEANDWKSSTYNFDKAKKILVLEPTFSYPVIPTDSNDKFEKYPFGEEKFSDSLNNRLKKLPKCRFYNLAYIDTMIKGDPDLPVIDDSNSREFIALREQELPKYADLILTVKVSNYGWYYEYYAAYDSTETKTEKVQYGGTTEDGKEYSGWMEVPKEVTVHHPAGYEICDDANVTFSLTDTKTNKVVWSYVDSRYRSSFSWSGNRDNTGPESMMNRILEAAISKMPLVK